MTREEALALLKKYNKEPFHLQHAFTVEGVMRWYANELGHGDEADFWARVGLLHDVDFEQWPEQHCKKAPELLAEIGADDAFVHAVCSHGYGLCSDVEPVLEMEKVLFAADELTGLVGAAALMRVPQGRLRRGDPRGEPALHSRCPRRGRQALPRRHPPGRGTPWLGAGQASGQHAAGHAGLRG